MTESPQWKRPSDIMKRHRQKKRVSIQRLPSNDLFASEVFGVNSPSSQAQTKRRNPFSKDNTDNVEVPCKRQRNSLEEATQNQTEDLAFFKALGETKNTSTKIKDIEIEKTPAVNYIPEEEDSRSQFDFIEKFFKSKKNKMVPPQITKKEEKKEGPTPTLSFPVDWSLKVKMRIVSSQPLTWCTQLKTIEEARGITTFTTGLQQINDNDKSLFQSCCLYWMYPNFPWMKMFPRIVPENNIKRSDVDLFTDDVQKALQSEWTESFSSAFHQMRAQQCPYFYVCTHQFTVLFRTRGIAGSTFMTAFLTPTTRGLRESLKNEDVEFTMPVLNSKRRKSVENMTDLGKENEEQNENSTPNPREDEEDEELIDTDEGAHVWLESIGLDKKSFPSLDPNKVKIQREGFKVIDNRPESLVYVEGTNVHGLFNFLLNCRSCVATSGPQAGVPPTILSPSPFKGSTLKSQKVKHSIARQPDVDGSIRQVHILEVGGPVLPHNVHTVSSVLKNTQNKNFTLTFNTHEPTHPFNIKCSSTEEPSVDIRQSLRMENSIYDSFFNGQCISDRVTSIHELVCDKEGYTYVS